MIVFIGNLCNSVSNPTTYIFHVKGGVSSHKQKLNVNILYENFVLCHFRFFSVKSCCIKKLPSPPAYSRPRKTCINAEPP